VIGALVAIDGLLLVLGLKKFQGKAVT